MLFNGEDYRMEKNPGICRSGTPVNLMKESDMPAPVPGVDDGPRQGR